MFWVIVLLEHPWPLTQTQLSDARSYITGQNLLIVSRFHDSLHTVYTPSARGSKTTPKHIWTSTIFNCRYRVLFFVGLIPFSVNSRMTCFAKQLYLSLICPQNILPEELRLTQVCSCKLQSGFFMPPYQKWGFPQSPAIVLYLIQMTTYVHWGCLSTIRTILRCILSSIFLFHPRPERFATVPWVINFLIILCTLDKGTRLTCNLEIADMFPQFCFLSPQTILGSSFSSPCLVWHTPAHNTKVESTFIHSNWLQFRFLYCQHPLLATGEFKRRSHDWNEIIYPQF